MSIRSMTVRVRSVPPCVSSQIGSRHLPLKQGIVSSSLTWRTSFISGCGVTQASESWELVATVRFCPPRPFASLVQLVQDTALPTLRHRFESGTMLQIFLRSCSSKGRARRFETGAPARQPRWGGTSRLRVQVLPGVPILECGGKRQRDAALDRFSKQGHCGPQPKIQSAVVATLCRGTPKRGSANLLPGTGV